MKRTSVDIESDLRINAVKSAVTGAISGVLNKHKDLLFSELLTALAEVQTSWSRYLLHDDRKELNEAAEPGKL